jgi:hypothetical protein
LNEAMPPEQVMALRTQGFLLAHARRAAIVQKAFDKQWRDTDRTRALRQPRAPDRLAPLARPTDRHTLERVLQEREAERLTDDERGAMPLRREPLPLEDCAFPRPRPRV